MKSMSFFDERKSDTLWPLGSANLLEHISHHSSDGNLEKWRVDCSGFIYWLKSSSFSRTGEEMFECESECIACRLAEQLGLDNVLYYDMGTLQKNTGDKIKVCYSKEFDEDNIIYYDDAIPGVAQLVGEGKWDAVTEFNPSAVKSLQDLMLFDILIGNTDRHLHNVAFDVETGSFLLFDNGAGLCGSVPTNVLKNAIDISFNFHKCRPFYDTVGNQIKLIETCTFNSVSQTWLKELVEEFLDKKRAKLITRYLVNNFRKVEDYFELSLLT